MFIILIGSIAGFLCTVSFLPQVIKILQTKDTKSISLTTFCLFSSGVLLWSVYGFLIKDLPIIMTNTVIFVLSLIIVFMKFRYK